MIEEVLDLRKLRCLEFPALSVLPNLSILTFNHNRAKERPKEIRADENYSFCLIFASIVFR